MGCAWYEQENIRDQLILFGRAVQGVHPFDVLIEPDPIKCHSAYCNFTSKRIAVNPTFFPLSPSEQYMLTKALLIHEAAHRRYSMPEPLPGLVREVANILEDERVDRKMCSEFAGAEWFLKVMSHEFLKRAKPIDSSSNSPEAVVFYFLQLRWANRAGEKIKGSLSPANQALWEKIKPLVIEAWQADNPGIVNRNAYEIVSALGFSTQHIKEEE